MRHHLQYSATKYHWWCQQIPDFPQSPVAMFAGLPLMVSGWCSLHAHSSPWAFLALEGPVSPSAAGETTVHTFTTLLLLVGGACYQQHPLICYPLHWSKFNVIVNILFERQSWPTPKILSNCPHNWIRQLDENDILYIYTGRISWSIHYESFCAKQKLAYCGVKLCWI